MAVRPVFIAEKNFIGVKKLDMNFKWFPGMAKVQKQKSIDSLHSEVKKHGINKILEISSKSKDELGVELSAFNLSFVSKNNNIISVESAFQGSKVFEKGGPYTDILTKTSREAKKDIRLKESGNLKSFRLIKNNFPINPKTYFYDWVYINTLSQPNNIELANKIMNYEAFTDIEFNPDKSINCQAYSAALFVSLKNNNKLEDALSSPENFLKILKNVYEKKDEKIHVQKTLLY